MRKKNFIHICNLDKFIPPFIDFVEKHFDFENHLFYIWGDINNYPLKRRSNIRLLSERRGKVGILLGLLEILFASIKADKIIFHGLFNIRVILLFFFFPWLLKKGYWIIWGGDLYQYKQRNLNYKARIKEYFRKHVIRNMGFLVVNISGEVELCRKWYNAEGKHINIFTYPSVLFREIHHEAEDNHSLYILVGNSANPTNNHAKIFEIIKHYKDKNIKIYCPLSYGNQEYANEIVDKGKACFGDKFFPLLKFIEFDNYMRLLAKIDIAVFAHDRQQAMGNTITLLGMGKKVHMNPDTTSYQHFCELGIKVFTLEEFSLNKDFPERRKNIEIIKNFYSQERLIQNLSILFGLQAKY